MAVQLDNEFNTHAEGWRGFARFLLVSTIGVVVILGLLALFLL